jgi:hypothetical protein
MISFSFFDRDLLDAQDILLSHQNEMSLKEFMLLAQELEKRGYRFGFKRSTKNVEIVFNKYPTKAFLTRIKEWFFPNKKINYYQIRTKAYGPFLLHGR